jgi:hypothetical protein
MLNEVERLEVQFKEALTSRDKAKLHEIHVSAIGLISRRERPPVIAASKKAYEQLIRAYVCHVASNDAGLPFLIWWKAYYGDQKPPKKPQHSVARSRSHLREMKKYSPLTSKLCKKYKLKT